jgi:hypothetical protein
MLVPAPLLDGDCLIKILRGEGHEVVEVPGNPFADLIRGDLLPWEINRNDQFFEAQIGPLFASIGLDPEKVVAYKERYCGQTPGQAGSVPN